MIDRERLQVLALNMEACLAEVRAVLSEIPVTVKLSDAEHVDNLFLCLLLIYEKAGRKVSSATGANYAPHLFATEASAKGVGKPAIEKAMRRLLDTGRIAVISSGAPSRRTKRLVDTQWGTALGPGPVRHTVAA